MINAARSLKLLKERSPIFGLLSFSMSLFMA